MILRKLEQAEHGRTRKLWEEVFSEDTREFLDYYYFVKARDNGIFVVVEDEDIRAMLQLNPYSIAIREKTFPSCYIIAVATEKAYRGRGYMGALLRESMREMYGKKIPFTFLMPAAEAIYTPYDFRFIYDQALGEIRAESKVEKGEMEAAQTGETGDAMLWDAEQMADFFHSYFEGKWQVYARRNPEYYRTMILEQQSEHGGVRLIKEAGAIKGMFAYAREDNFEIREPLYLPEYEQRFAGEVRRLCESMDKPAKIYGSTAAFCTGSKPLIMARIICLSEFLSALTVSLEQTLDCSFAVIDPIIVKNSRVWKLYSGSGEREIHVRETEDSEGVLPIAELTELLFGRKTVQEIKKSPGVIVSEHLEKELGKIEKLEKTFLNEIV